MIIETAERTSSLNEEKCRVVCRDDKLREKSKKKEF